MKCYQSNISKKLLKFEIQSYLMMTDYQYYQYHHYLNIPSYFSKVANTSIINWKVYNETGTGIGSEMQR